MESENLKDKIQQQTVETDTLIQLMQLFKKQDDFVKQALKFLDDLRQTADVLNFSEEYNKQAQKQFISEIRRIKGALEYNRYIDIDFKLKMAILLVELPEAQREIFFLIGIKKYSSLAEIGRARTKGRTRQAVDGILKQMFQYFLYGNTGKFNIAQKTIFANADTQHRHDEISEIQALCANMPQNAEIIINSLFDEFLLLDKDKQAKESYINKLLEMYRKKENNDIQPDDFYIL
ncbi:hypothetical protein IJ541_05145 [bacterium]|nr:hypothetical protein [bacterium]